MSDYVNSFRSPVVCPFKMVAKQRMKVASDLYNKNVNKRGKVDKTLVRFLIETKFLKVAFTAKLQ